MRFLCPVFSHSSTESLCIALLFKSSLRGHLDSLCAAVAYLLKNNFLIVNCTFRKMSYGLCPSLLARPIDHIALVTGTRWPSRVRHLPANVFPSCLRDCRRRNLHVQLVVASFRGHALISPVEI